MIGGIDWIGLSNIVVSYNASLAIIHAGSVATDRKTGESRFVVIRFVGHMHDNGCAVDGAGEVGLSGANIIRRAK